MSEATSRVIDQNCSRKYIALGRIVQHWADIVGADMAAIAQPAKMHYSKKPGQKSPEAILEIATSPAHATTLHYRKDLILEKMNRIFGADWVTGIRFTAKPAKLDLKKKRKKFIEKPLAPSQKADLASTLDAIADEEMKIKLEKLGEAVINTSH